MKVIAAFLLAVLGGNTNPSADDLKAILGSVGAEADDDKIEMLLSEVKGKDITELIASGREKLASVPIWVSASSTKQVLQISKTSYMQLVVVM
ncbi:hypothetical protein GOBAR_AA15868 [Gossypium barbadense]|uniref:60S acidic ribosomal protein P2 n=1 Tax=Gossypium barbadense TaxID=3634 RepID=A0A2P5XN67_GOSBA|nr:hypothetical protein GOBAR_AA15868 [Gossypium barbadense]